MALHPVTTMESKIKLVVRVSLKIKLSWSNIVILFLQHLKKMQIENTLGVGENVMSYGAFIFQMFSCGFVLGDVLTEITSISRPWLSWLAYRGKLEKHDRDLLQMLLVSSKKAK